MRMPNVPNYAREMDKVYIELQGKGKVRLNYGDDHIILQKYIDDDKYFIKVEFERRDEA